ncbi:hypothetical protein HDU83_003052 [Entophlyctis luteolus]|nr:hypothetical protein HDU83_003052 [Entophlyctis luteolus]
MGANASQPDLVAPPDNGDSRSSANEGLHRRRTTDEYTAPGVASDPDRSRRNSLSATLLRLRSATLTRSAAISPSALVDEPARGSAYKDNLRPNHAVRALSGNLDMHSPRSASGSFSAFSSIPSQPTIDCVPGDANSVLGAGSSESKLSSTDPDILRLLPLIEEDSHESEERTSLSRTENSSRVSSSVPADADYSIPIGLSDYDVGAELLQNAVSEAHESAFLADELNRASSSESSHELINRDIIDVDSSEGAVRAVTSGQEIASVDDGLIGAPATSFRNTGAELNFVPSTLSSNLEEINTAMHVSREPRFQEEQLEPADHDHGPPTFQEDRGAESQRNEQNQERSNHPGVSTLMRVVVVLHGSDGSVRVAQIPIGFGFVSPQQAGSADSASSPPVPTTADSREARVAPESNGDGDANDYDALVRLADLLGPARPRHAHIDDVREQLPPLLYKSAAFSDSLNDSMPLGATLVNTGSIQAENASNFIRLKSMVGETREKCTICLMNYEEDDEMRILRCRHGFHAECIDRWLTSHVNSCPVCRQPGVEISRTPVQQPTASTGRPPAILDIISALGRMLSPIQSEPAQAEGGAIPQTPAGESYDGSRENADGNVNLLHQTPSTTATGSPPAATPRQMTPAPLNRGTETEVNSPSTARSTEEAGQHGLRDALFPVFAHLFLRELLLGMTERANQSQANSPEEPATSGNDEQSSDSARILANNVEHPEPQPTTQEEDGALEREDEDRHDLFEILGRMNATLGRNSGRGVPTPPLTPEQPRNHDNDNSDSDGEVPSQTRPLGSEFRLLDDLLLRFGEDNEEGGEDDNSRNESENFHLEPMYVHREFIDSLYGEDIDDIVDD